MYDSIIALVRSELNQRIREVERKIQQRKREGQKTREQERLRDRLERARVQFRALRSGEVMFQVSLESLAGGETITVSARGLTEAFRSSINKYKRLKKVEPTASQVKVEVWVVLPGIRGERVWVPPELWTPHSLIR